MQIPENRNLSSATGLLLRFKTVTLQSWTLFALVVSGIFVRVWFIYFSNFFQEDALITMRYSRNLWHGLGFVFNPGEHVLGATSPLWTILLSPITGMFDFPVASKLIALLGVVAFTGVSIIAWSLAGAWKIPFSSKFLLIALLTLHPTLVLFSVSGMEAPLFVFIILLSSYGITRRHYKLAAAMAGLSLLARPEGILWIGCFLLYFLIVERRVPWREFGLTVAVVLPWVIFATFYFGSPVPQSAIAKTN